MDTEKHLILWDGDCGFCHWSVDRLMSWDRKQKLRSIPRQQCPSPPMTDLLQDRTDREVVVITRSGEVLGGADAVFFVYGETRSRWIAAILRTPPFIWVARWVYRWVARNRATVSRWLKLEATCEVPRKPS
jgi:predicted DCC family thiol-disulfide oxidoreductase YuxK